MSISRTRLIIIGTGLAIAILLAIIGVLGWKYRQADQAATKKTTASAEETANAAKETTARVLREVGELYLLPTNEEPTVAQIKDKTQLAGNQDFFKNAQDNDYLLVYKDNRIALIYRDSIRKLITVGPVNFDNSAEQGKPTNTR